MMMMMMILGYSQRECSTSGRWIRKNYTKELLITDYSPCSALPLDENNIQEVTCPIRAMVWLKVYHTINEEVNSSNKNHIAVTTNIITNTTKHKTTDELEIG
jgi:hypothetical protein